MAANQQTWKSRFRRELATFVILALLGAFFLPLVIYLVGSEIFGAFAGSGFGDFYRTLHSDLRDGQPVVLFLLLSPYLVWQLLRLTFYTFRRMAPPR